MKLLSSLFLCGLVAFLTGCVATADGHTKAGIPLAKDTITTRFDRSTSQVQIAARKVLSDGGTLTVDHIAAKTLEAQINERTVWVKIESIEPQLSEVTVQARSKWGTDINLAADISTKIALQLTTIR